MKEHPQGLATCASPARVANAKTIPSLHIPDRLLACPRYLATDTGPQADGMMNGRAHAGSSATALCPGVIDVVRFRGTTLGINDRTCLGEDTPCARVISPYEIVRTAGVTCKPIRSAISSLTSRMTCSAHSA